MTYFDVSLVHRLAHNYIACMVPIPLDLVPEELAVAAQEQERVYNGLRALHRLVASLYQWFTVAPLSDKIKDDNNSRCQVIEGPLVLLWGLGVTGQLNCEPDGPEWVVDMAALRQVIPTRRLKDLAHGVPALEQVGFAFVYRNADGSDCPQGLKHCTSVTVRYQADHANAESLLRAVAFYARRLNLNQDAEAVAFERADYRILLPGADVETLAYTEEEALRAMDAPTAALWQDLRQHTAARYPRYVQTFMTPIPRSRNWHANYSTTGKGYGVWSTLADESGFRVRMVLRARGRKYLLEHIDELTPKMQEVFLTKVSCHDCKSCGKHEMYLHGVYVHKLCASAWFYSPNLEAEDMPSIKRMLDIHLSHLR